MAAYRRVDDLHLRADCLYTGISSGPNARYRVLESLYLYLVVTRSTETVHTSAKAHLTSVVIQIRIRDSDCHQNLIICSLAIGPFPIFPENFMQIRLEVLA